MAMLPFERSEYLERLGKTKQRMAAAGIDVLLVSNEHNMNYLSGYDGYSSYVPQFLMVAGDVDEPLWVGREMDVGCALNSVFIDHAGIVGYPERYIGDPDLHPMGCVNGGGRTADLASNWTPNHSHRTPTASCSGICRTRSSSMPAPS